VNEKSLGASGAHDNPRITPNFLIKSVDKNWKGKADESISSTFDLQITDGKLAILENEVTKLVTQNNLLSSALKFYQVNLARILSTLERCLPSEPAPAKTDRYVKSLIEVPKVHFKSSVNLDEDLIKANKAHKFAQYQN